MYAIGLMSASNNVPNQARTVACPQSLHLSSKPVGRSWQRLNTLSDRAAAGCAARARGERNACPSRCAFSPQQPISVIVPNNVITQPFCISVIVTDDVITRPFCIHHHRHRSFLPSGPYHKCSRYGTGATFFSLCTKASCRAQRTRFILTVMWRAT